MCECKRVHASVERMQRQNETAAVLVFLCLGLFSGLFLFFFLFTALMDICTLPSVFIIYLLEVVQPSEDKDLLILTVYSLASVKGGLLSSPSHPQGKKPSSSSALTFAVAKGGW